MFSNFSQNESSLIIAGIVVVIYLGYRFGRIFLIKKKDKMDRLSESQFQVPDYQNGIENNKKELDKDKEIKTITVSNLPLTKNLEKFRKLLG